MNAIKYLIVGIMGIVGIAFMVFLWALIVALPIMLLWNWLMPSIFGLIKINFWKALGLSILSGLLFNQGKAKSKD